MDSGSALNVAEIQTHFKSYANDVVPSPGSKSGETATTTCEKQLAHPGKSTEHGTADGQNIAIPFQDMDVDLPTASAQQRVTSGNRVMSHGDGGEMKSRQAG